MWGCQFSSHHGCFGFSNRNATKSDQIMLNVFNLYLGVLLMYIVCYEVLKTRHGFKFSVRVFNDILT